MFWLFVIFGFLAKTHEIRHFSLGNRKRRRMVSLHAIILGAHTQCFLGHLKIIFSPKMVKNTHFFNILPRFISKVYFLGFCTQAYFWRTSRHQIGKIKDVPEIKHSELSNELSCASFRHLEDCQMLPASQGAFC